MIWIAAGAVWLLVGVPALAVWTGRVLARRRLESTITILERRVFHEEHGWPGDTRPERN